MSDIRKLVQFKDVKLFDTFMIVSEEFTKHDNNTAVSNNPPFMAVVVPDNYEVIIYLKSETE